MHAAVNSIFPLMLFMFKKASIGKIQMSSQYHFYDFTLTEMTQTVHIAWTAAAFANKDIVDGMNDLVSEKNGNIEPTLLNDISVN